VDAGISMARELGLAAYVQADLAVDADRIRLVQEAVAQWGRLDVVVNNAGISRVVPHADMEAATLTFGASCTRSMSLRRFVSLQKRRPHCGRLPLMACLLA
jgi:NAD(P)-dependent dehydrogenase (short-subunit alcohol dehydrogenase family)